MNINSQFILSISFIDQDYDKKKVDNCGSLKKVGNREITFAL